MADVAIRTTGHHGAMAVRHRQEKSEMIGTGGDPIYRAVCSCGWTSGLVSPMTVHAAWEDHVDEARRAAAR
jgi:hypothetical protein